jgi:hypothetical protein
LSTAAGYYFWQYSRLKSDPSLATQETTARLKTAIGKLYALPTDEEPTVAQISDKDKLKDQTFFAKAQNGDYILIYTKAKLALLYREKENKLINVGPVSISDTSQTQSPNSPNPSTTTPTDTTKK